MQVLTVVYWPSFGQLTYKLPPAMEACQKMFTQYFEAAAARKKLAWVYTQGSAAVTGSFKGVKYEFQLTTLQATVLSLFNDLPPGGALTYEAIAQKLAMGTGGAPDKEPGEQLKVTLHSFACSKYRVLLKTPESNKIAAGDSFRVNADFSDKLRKLRIQVATLDVPHDPKRTEEDRGYAIEAAVVRIMKARKTLDHGNLVAAVIEQLHFFKPNPKDIKKKIEGLLERDYLTREETGPDGKVGARYSYVA